MDMSGYWSYVTDKLTEDQVKATYPEAYADYLSDRDVFAGGSMGVVEFAYDVIPAVGPGGCTSDEDEEAVGDDEEGDNPPSLTGEQSLMFYAPDVDELYLWYPEQSSWVLWNY